MKKCFVIQPFDGDKFDQRFEDTYKPAIEKAGLIPYRIDRDETVRIPIERIEGEISNSAICLADITLDNPNVWYELGFAFACGKDVVMICSEEREIKSLPFDIRHKNIISYKTGSLSDFNRLGEQITTRLTQYLQTADNIESLRSSPIIESHGLNSHEVAALVLIMSNLTSVDSSVSIYTLRAEMERAGINTIGASIAVRSLAKKGFIQIETLNGDWNEIYDAYKITEAGELWVLQNQSQFDLKIAPTKRDEPDSLPF